MPVSTKQRIIDASVRLFNEYGIDAVRLQQIAEETGISVGNLAYHFKSKDAIIELVNEQVLDEFRHIFRQYLQTPELVAFDQQISLYFHFFSQYQFYLAEFFKHTPAPTPQQTAWQLAVHKMMLQLRSWLDFHVQRGALRPETPPGHYQQLAQTIWMTLIFLPASCTMRGLDCSESRYRQTIWEHLFPYLTQTGAVEFDEAVAPLLR